MNISKKSIAHVDRKFGHTSIIIDTGIFLALGLPADQYHKRALKMLAETKDLEWVTTWPVIVEASYLLGRVSSAKATLLYHSSKIILHLS